MLITSKDDFESFLRRAKSSHVLAIDTEFLREKSYYSKLCLLQLGTFDEVALVDPFAIKDLSVLEPILTNKNIVKVFHAGSQDLEILLHEVGVLPSPVFDTQIAAALLGFSQQCGYGALVGSICGVSLKKTDSYTDWSRRPLAPSQLEYAADDVLYLPRIYDTMIKELTKTNRLSWLDDDFAKLCDLQTYVQDPYERYRKLKRVSHLTQRQLGAARELAAWRELEAQKRNIPRKWILTDEQIVEACRKEAGTIDELFLIRGIKDHLSTRDARCAANCIKKGLSLDDSLLPCLDTPQKNEHNVDEIVDVMTAVARIRAKQYDVALQTLAPHAELIKLARGHYDDCELMYGWRRSLLGDELRDLLDGKIVVKVRNNQVVIERQK